MSITHHGFVEAGRLEVLHTEKPACGEGTGAGRGRSLQG